MKQLESKIIHIVLLMLVVLAFLSTPAKLKAQCTSGTNQAERDLWATLNCWEEFVLWQYQAYRMYDEYWNGWGFRDYCNINREYPKAVNASYLVTYGLNEDYSFQWHGTIDYRQVAEAWASPSHDQMFYTPSTRTGLTARAVPRWPGDDQTEMGCGLFNPELDFANPVSRAGAYIHEGWHHWQFKRNFDGTHITGGACASLRSVCDWFYPHGVGAYDFGAMHYYTTDGTFFHSPYQAQIEFLCDISESSNSFVPASVRMIARAEANLNLLGRFRNAVAFQCGDPRPW